LTHSRSRQWISGLGRSRSAKWTWPWAWDEGRRGAIEYQTSLFRGQPDNEAVKEIQYFEALALQHDPRGYGICTSEGKDSRVLGHLFRRAGVKHFYMHNITGIDPPELVYFQRRNFQHYRELGHITYDIMYNKSMWALMEQKKFPPLRQIRYCCAELKKSESPEKRDCIVCLGVRKHESHSRALRRGEMEIVQENKRKQNILLAFDDDENRRTFELCYRNHEKRFNPIVRWSNEDVWNYSSDAKLEQCCLYQEGFHRLGCIGCPMAREAGRRQELDRWPGFRKLYLRTFRRMAETRRKQNMRIMENGESAEEWFEWWLSDRAQEQPDENQLDLWDQ
jgi:phosphoadenosine phosphosulfate reductase